MKFSIDHPMTDPFYVGITENPTEHIIAQARAIISFTFDTLDPSKTDKNTLVRLQNNFEFLVAVYDLNKAKEVKP
jgi:hypothetical protein